MDVAIFTLCEVPLDAPQRIIDESTLECRLTQTTRRQTTGFCAAVHRAQRHPLILCYPGENETHDVHQAIVSRHGAVCQTVLNLMTGGFEFSVED